MKSMKTMMAFRVVDCVVFKELVDKEMSGEWLGMPGKCAGRITI